MSRSRTLEDAADPPAVRARGVRKDYGYGEGLVRAVSGIDLTIENGETVAVMGPSGCGKSTLLHLIGGLERLSEGKLWLGEQRIDQCSEKEFAVIRRTQIGFVFQAFQLMEELTAIENVEMPALLAGVPPRAARVRAEELMNQVGMSDRQVHLPSALSGGQRQRVAIARALSNHPAVLLADEPTGNLDSEATSSILKMFETLHLAGQTLVIVTHDPRVAATADRTIRMRDGRFLDDAVEQVADHRDSPGHADTPG